MIIRTADYVIRNIVQSDLNIIKEISQDKEIHEYIPNLYNYIKCHYDSMVPSGLCLAVENTEGKFIGAIIATPEMPEQYDITYFLVPEYRGKNRMLSIMKIFIEWMKENCICESLSFQIDSKNKSSISVAENLGADLFFETACGTKCYFLIFDKPV